MVQYIQINKSKIACRLKDISHVITSIGAETSFDKIEYLLETRNKRNFSQYNSYV